MTVVLELTPEFESRLQATANRQGVTVETAVAEAVAEWLEEQEDIGIAEERLANTDAAQWRSLDEWRQAIDK